VSAFDENRKVVLQNKFSRRNAQTGLHCICHTNSRKACVIYVSMS